MPIVAVTGDVCTTTSIALASAWPSDGDILVVEADPSGGDMAAWFDMPVIPSLSTIVTTVLDGAWPAVERLTRVSDAGLRLIPAPARAAEAALAIAESARSIVPTLASLTSQVTIVDAGGLPLGAIANPFVRSAALTIVVHWQSDQSTRAAAVRLQRLADQLEVFGSMPTAVVVAVVGTAPFDVAEIEKFLADSVGVNAIVGLPVDELAAAVFGGRTGVSARRLARLPLLRAAVDLARVAEYSLAAVSGGRTRVGS